MSTPVYAIYLVLLVSGAVPALAFPIYYSVATKWWRLPRGPRRETAGHLMVFSTFFALLYARAGINLTSAAWRDAVVHQSPGAATFLMFLAALAAFVCWQRLWLFHKGRTERG